LIPFGSIRNTRLRGNFEGVLKRGQWSNNKKNIAKMIDHINKQQYCLKVGTDKPKLKSRCSQYQMMPGKDFLESHARCELAWRRKVYSDWEDV